MHQVTILKCKLQIWQETPLEWNDKPSHEGKKTEVLCFSTLFEDGVVGMQAFKQLQLFFSQAVCLVFTLWLETFLIGGGRGKKCKLSLTLTLILN